MAVIRFKIDCAFSTINFLIFCINCKNFGKDIISIKNGGMFMLKKILSIVLCVSLILSVTLLVGCGDSGSADVYFLNFKPESANVYIELAETYQKETGVKVKVVTAAANTYEQTLKSEMAKTSAPTIFQINGPKGYANWKDYCKDLKNTAIYSALSDKDLSTNVEKCRTIWGRYRRPSTCFPPPTVILYWQKI